MINEKEIMESLKKVMDPELGCSVVDLGLIYKIEIDPSTALRASKVTIEMTLTSPGCPLADMIGEDIKKEVKKIKGVKTVEIKTVFDPPWTPEKMAPALRKKFGF